MAKTSRYPSSRTHYRVLIFVSLWLFFPAIYFVLVAAGWLPAILYVAFCFGPDALFWVIHVCVYMIIYSLATAGLTRLLFRIADPRSRAYVLYGTIGLMALASLFPIYAVGLHARGDSVNIVGAFRDAKKLSTVPW